MAPNGVKRRKLEHDSSDDDANSKSQQSTRKTQKAFISNASNWNLEEDYESRPRKNKKSKKEQERAAASNRLPLKNTDSGRLEIIRNIQADDAAAGGRSSSDEDGSDTEWLGVDGDRDGRGEEDDRGEARKYKHQPKENPKPEREQILQAQEELARLATAVSEDPEENVGAFRALGKLGATRILPIKVLTLMTQMTVYKDVIPGYRIRAFGGERAKEKLVSKEVRQLRSYEESLLSGYQSYLKELAKCARDRRDVGSGTTLASVAVTCACTLLTAVPHFNLREDLLRILVGKLSMARLDADGARCIDALETLFREDDEGRPSMEAVALLSKMMRARNYRVSERVLDLFLSLRLLSEFSGQASYNSVERTGDSAGPKQKKKREFRTKRLRKDLKEQKALEKEMIQADALVSHEERDRMQSETLKLVFATYFRILKARSPQLMGAVLEGLAKYAHLINQDFFGDLLEALKDLIRYSDLDAAAAAADDDDLNRNRNQDQSEHPEDQDGNQDDGAGESSDESEEEAEEEEESGDVSVRNLTRESLLCTVTAYALLAGQDAHNARSDLHLDLSFFTNHLYTSLMPLSLNPDLELSKPASGSASTDSKINVQTTTVLLLRSLTSVLLPSYNIRSVPPTRLAAFAKQLSSVALQLPDRSAQGVLALLHDVARTHGRRISSLWNTEERKGDGRFNPVASTVEGTNPFAATVWEGELLKKHFSPKVREGARMLEKAIASS
ncbi:nucleolar complex protein 3 [Geosmithia morbida]|uniref:Nucleolar complex-associated protein 3 n=1 Tax=Geosmithia morbida TaxID=1094350 RepID=A0A9P4YVD3_9HYPO|nr:nucleolar complex protein 3 [Geosmithia morbida]KAF4123222.1 nucleolar complex protein 3 [Geosmithia morbida]